MRLALFVIVIQAVLGTGANAGGASAKTPVILDTDIGTDIDDAFALALIINSPELELQGVTTVSGDTQARARLAAKLLWEAGGAFRRVPVYAGEPGKPLPIEQARWAEHFASPQLKSEKAVDFLRHEFNARPGQSTLITIGPLTNIGALLKQDPAVAKKIPRIVMMGGAIARGYEPGSGPTPEYNIAADVAASRVVFDSGIPLIVAPLDVTARLQLEGANLQRVLTHLTSVTDALTLLYHLWGLPAPTLHDPMAIALYLDPSLCETKRLAVEVDTKGFTRVAEGKPANATVALNVDREKFFQFYLSRVAP